MSVPYQIPALFLTVLCHVVVVYYMAEHKYSIKKFVFYGCFFITGFVGIMGYGYAVGGTAAFWAYMAIVVCLFLFSCTVSRDCFPKKCFLFITYFCLFSGLDNILKLTLNLLLPGLPVRTSYYAAIILRSAALLLVLAFYQKYAAAVFRTLIVNSGRWWNLALIALLFYLLQAALSILNVKNVMSNEQLLLIFAALSFLMCAVYGVVFSNISYMKKDAEAALVRQNAEYLSNSLSSLREAENTYRRLRHDMRHHLETIAEYARSGDTSAVLAYIGEYGMEISETELKRYSLNKTINSILSVYAGKAEENGISFSIKCNTPAELSIRDIDLIALMGNLLENALHGCRKSGKEEQSIKIHIRVQGSRLVIICDNTCSDDLKLSGNLPAGKSIGISSILSVCRKYDGNLDYKVENGTCFACVVLILSDIQEKTAEYCAGIEDSV